jgi:hypothetical protein
VVVGGVVVGGVVTTGDAPPPGDPPLGAVGVTEVDAVEADEVPAPLVAVAVNVYALPAVSPVIVHEPDAPVTVQVPAVALLLSRAVTVYDVGVPPDDGATTVTVALPAPATAVGVPGTPGGATGSTGLGNVGGVLVLAPLTLIGVTRKSYDVPFVRPVTV